MVCRCVEDKFLIIALSDFESEKIEKILPSFFDMDFDYSPIEKSAQKTIIMQVIMSAIVNSNALFLTAEPIEPLIIKTVPKDTDFEQNMLVVCRESTFIGEFVKIGRRNDNSVLNRRVTIHLHPKRLFYRFDDFFDAYDCISALVSHKIIPKKCMLWGFDDRFFISLQISAQSRRNTGFIMSEFGKRIPVSAEKIILERARIICDDFYNEVKRKTAK